MIWSLSGSVLTIFAMIGPRLLAALQKLWQNNVSSFSGVSQGFGNVYVADEDGTVTVGFKNRRNEETVLVMTPGKSVYDIDVSPAEVTRAVADEGGWVPGVKATKGKK